jgi:hypothetical protein
MNTKSYQDTIYESLKETFREIAVSREWDSIKK